MANVQDAAGCKVLLALKAFALWKAFPLVGRYLSGASASSLNEARLAADYLGGELHVCAPAYPPEDFPKVQELADHIVFNNMTQWEYFGIDVGASGRNIRYGLRINPEHSQVQTIQYDPCSSHSRLGIRAAHLRDRLPEGIDGLHFHTLCESGVEELVRTVAVVQERFARWLNQIRWINFGGGHHITKPNYGVDRLIDLVRDFRRRYQVDVYLERGEAVALNAGYLVASVLDIVPGDS